MKLSDLKVKVYALADVSTTSELKQKYAELRSLDLRRKDAWQTALSIVESPEFESWLENPPEEYRELFEQTAQVFEEFDQQVAAVRQLSSEGNAISDQLDQLSEEFAAEAAELEREVQAARRMAKQAEQN
jgi:hypothetical protein